MKKRLLCLILCVILTLAVIPFSAAAGNGPSTEKYEEAGGYVYYPAYGRFYQLDDSGEYVFEPDTFTAVHKSFYADGKVVNEMHGATYDISGGKNVLKLNGINEPNYLLAANMLGEDFKIEVHGVCRLAGISVWGWGYGGSLTIDGPGKLILNEKKIVDNAILMSKEESPNFFLRFGSEVSIDLYAGTNDNSAPLRLFGLSSESERPITFANGNPSYTVEPDYYDDPVSIEGFYTDDIHEDGGFKLINKDDPEGVYSGGIWKIELDTPNERDVIHVDRLIYCEQLGAYIIDQEYAREHSTTDWGEIQFENDEELFAAGYSYAKDGSGNPIYNDFLTCSWLMNENLYVDPAGKEYVFHSIYIDEEEIEVPYYATPIEGMDGVYIFEPVPEGTIDRNDLKAKIETILSGYSTRIGGTEYHYVGKAKKALPFKDVAEGMWYTEGIRYCYENGLMNGTSPTTFAPNNPFTRAMFVTVLANIEGADVSSYKGKPTSFKDVKPSDWFAPYVEWAYDKGYTNGAGAGIFSPNSAVTREMIAQFFYNYSSIKKYDVSQRDDLARFTDKNTISSWAKTAVQWAVACKLINGLSPTTLAPRNSATRAQVALITATYHEGLMRFAH